MSDNKRNNTIAIIALVTSVGLMVGLVTYVPIHAYDQKDIASEKLKADSTENATIGFDNATNPAEQFPSGGQLIEPEMQCNQIEQNKSAEMQCNQLGQGVNSTDSTAKIIGPE